MPQIVWDKPADRNYDSGLDRGVLYPETGPGVAWNGLTSVVEHFNRSTSPLYFDGMKFSDVISFGDYSASMKAVTYPDEFADIEGTASLRPGVILNDQVPQSFNLSYRTSIGDGVQGELTGYRLHILYHVTAIPADKTYATVSGSPSLTEFEWTLTAVSEEIDGFHPTAHIVIDSRTVDPLLLSDLESMMYGTQEDDPALMSLQDLVSYLNSWYRIKITDNGDGTFNIDINDELVDDLLTWTDGSNEGVFQLKGASAIFSEDGTTYDLSDTTDASNIAEIKIDYDLEGDFWTATADSPALIQVTDDGEFQILNANVIWLDDETYRISDTSPDS